MAAIMFVSSDGAIGFGLLLVSVIAGWTVVYVTLRRWLHAQLDEISIALYEHIQMANDRLQVLNASAPQPAAVQETQAAEPAAQEPAPAAISTSAAVPETPAAAPEAAAGEVPPEVLAIIAATVVHFCGAQARVRHAHPLPQADSVWAQQGRVYVQASHNLAAHRAHA